MKLKERSPSNPVWIVFAIKLINKKTRHLIDTLFMVHLTGLEPARTCVHMDLNHTRLPIPPQVHIIIYLDIISNKKDNVKQKVEKIHKKVKNRLTSLKFML